jgi:high-affinity iron transporter
MAAGLITFREGLEAALIVAIVAMYLTNVGRSDRMRTVWMGVGAAAAISLAIGAAVSYGTAELSSRAQEIFEGAAGLLAVAVLTWMVFWMRRQARSIRGHLEGRVDVALRGGAVALPLLAFTAVGREGLETVLFLFAAFRSSQDARGSAIGAVLGLAAAAVVGYGFYSGVRRVDLRRFFQVTGLLVIVVSAGLLASAIHELNEGGVLLVWTRHAWDTHGVVGTAGVPESLLRGLFGYNPRPTWLEVAAYWAYLIPALGAFRRTPSPRAARDSTPAAATA